MNDICGAEHEDTEGYWTCTLAPGHDDDHKAVDAVTGPSVVVSRWARTTTTTAAPEPTDEQYGQAGAIVYTVLSGVGGCGSLLDPDKTTRNVARALAAAVTAEREKVAALLAPGDPDARMNAYYYSFEPTGIGLVDGILSAVAQAGKSYHGTDMWGETEEWTPVSHEQLIQQAADDAARRIREVSR